MSGFDRFTFVLVIYLLCQCHKAAAAEPRTWDAVAHQPTQLGELTLRVSKPIAVAISKAGEKRWGHHQFPTISKLPDGRFMLTYNETADADTAYGEPGPALVSADKGVTWRKFRPAHPRLTVSHSVISEVYDRQYLCIPMSSALDLRKRGLKMPAPVGTMNVYGEVQLFRADQCPREVGRFLGNIPAVRYDPQEKVWREETVGWDVRTALARTRPKEQVVPRPYLDNPLVKHAGALYYPDYHLNRLSPDGSIPKNYACWCMRSTDNGQTWQAHGQIAHDSSGSLMMGEPSLMVTSRGDFACVIRCSDHQQRPMLITYSADGGKHWDKPRELFRFGVMPQTLMLENKIAVVSFGRPGVRLLFSTDGSARSWSEPLSVIAGEDRAIMAHSCGYTSLMATGKNSFLLVYSDFQWPHPEGGTAKAILIRRVVVDRKKS